MIKRFLKIGLLVFANIVLVSFGYALNNLPLSVEDYAVELEASLPNTSSVTMRNVLIDYCSAVLNNSIIGANLTGDFYYYSAKDSIFLYMICTNVSTGFDMYFKFTSNSKFNTTKEGYFTKSLFQDLGVVGFYEDKNYDYCSLGSSLQYCDLSYHIPRIFNMIMNDIISIQQSRVYGLLTPDYSRKTIEQQIDEYSMHKFGIKFCDITDGKYPKVCKNMKTYAKASSNLLKGLNILNYDVLFNNFVEKGDIGKYFDTCKKSFGTYDFDFLGCGLFGYGFAINDLYLNLLYNELLYYALFVQYYNNVILDNPELAPMTHKDDYQTSINFLSNKAYEFNRGFNNSQKAISLSMKTLREMDVTFPLHVGFMMYQEDLLNLRDKSLYKIPTPFYTLYDKLRNVQTQN